MKGRATERLFAPSGHGFWDHLTKRALLGEGCGIKTLRSKRQHGRRGGTESGGHNADGKHHRQGSAQPINENANDHRLRGSMSGLLSGERKRTRKFPTPKTDSRAIPRIGDRYETPAPHPRSRRPHTSLDT